jgi:hypothetical protein
MLIVSTCTLIESAYHEAGHVVVAHGLDLRVNCARVAWDEARHRWSGGVKATPRLDDSELEIQVPVIAASKARESLAGMLAQAKFMAGQQIATDLLKFDPSKVNFDALWPLLKEGRRTVESPGSIQLEFVGPGLGAQSLRFQADACLISDADITNFNYYVNGQLGCRPAESPEDLVIETMRLLDDDAHWNSVGEIAQTLANEGQGRSLDEEELMRLLAPKLLPISRRI